MSKVRKQTTTLTEREVLLKRATVLGDAEAQQTLIDEHDMDPDEVTP